MTTWVLVLWFGSHGGTAVAIPNYPSLDACKAAGDYAAKHISGGALKYCIPGPK